MIYKNLLISFVFLFAIGCSSTNTIPEPNFEQTTVQSEPTCLSWKWYSPFFCYSGKANSVELRGTVSNNTGDKQFFLDYFLDSFDTDFPVGVAIKIDSTYYLLRKSQTDFSNTLLIRSEMSDEVISKLKGSSSSILLSYSNRSHTYNYQLSSGEAESLRKNAREVFDKLNSASKMKIVK
ncbi:MAG: hypothetical protein SFU98_12810 [Leptospiraceae bacterium]|nr:hypothetical protein [Leptospiraceae bacterium]